MLDIVIILKPSICIFKSNYRQPKFHTLVAARSQSSEDVFLSSWIFRVMTLTRFKLHSQNALTHKIRINRLHQYVGVTIALAYSLNCSLSNYQLYLFGGLPAESTGGREKYRHLYGDAAQNISLCVIEIFIENTQCSTEYYCV